MTGSLVLAVNHCYDSLLYNDTDYRLSPRRAYAIS
jgi:hypothetical protein